VLDSGKGAVDSGSVTFAVTVPKAFNYGVLPMIKTFTVNEHDLPSFQLSFVAVGNPCQRAG